MYYLFCTHFVKITEIWLGSETASKYMKLHTKCVWYKMKVPTLQFIYETWIEIKNTAQDTKLKLYSIYAAQYSLHD